MWRTCLLNGKIECNPTVLDIGMAQTTGTEHNLAILHI